MPPVNKPMEPPAWLYLHAAVQLQMARCKDKKLMAATDPRVVKQEKQRLKALLLRVKGEKGRVWWLLVAVCLMAYASIFVTLVLRPPLMASYIYSAPTDEWRVVSDVTESEAGYDVMLQRVHNGIPLPAEFRVFCRRPDDDYRPRFQIGMTLTYFAFDDRGDCISILAKDRQYNIERGPDPQGRPGLWPILPKNCTNLGLGKPVVCDGEPNWSK